MGNPLTWWEINGPDDEQTAKFYSEVFGWHVESIPGQNYHLIDTHSGKGFNGGIGRTREGQRPHSVAYAEGPDIQALLDKAEKLGAKTVVPVTEIPEMVTFAQFTDPLGNLMALVQGEGKVNVSEGSNPPIDWVEISSSDPKKAAEFYGELFGWKIEGGEAPDGTWHGSFDTGGPGGRGGIGGSPDGKPNVTLYAAVDDIKTYLDRAQSLGAMTVMEPTQVDEHTHIAIFVDPQGTAFGLYRYAP